MNKASAVWFLIILAVTSIALIDNVNAADSFHGIISSSVTWTKVNSPYTLDGPAAVASGVTITVEPGVTVNLNGHYLQVNGTLIARGTESEKIYFNNGQVIITSSATSGSIFENTVTNSLQTSATVKITKNTFNTLSAGGSSIVTATEVIETCTLSDSAQLKSNNINARIVVKRGSVEISNNRLSDGIHCDMGGGHVTITNNEIRNRNAYSLILVAGGDADISNNRLIGDYTSNGITIWGSYHSGIQTNAKIVENQISNCKTAIALSYCWAEIKRNAIYNNDLGIDIAIGSSFQIPAPGTNPLDIEQNTVTKNVVGVQFQPEGLTATISNNNIQNNTDYNFKLVGSEDVTVANNWWGTTSTAQITQKIYDEGFDFNLGKVNFDPISNYPVAQAPAVPADIPTPTQTATPTPTTPSTNPTTMPTETAPPTTLPTQSGNQPSFDLNTVEVAILAVLIIIAVLIVALILTIRRRKSPVCG